MRRKTAWIISAILLAGWLASAKKKNPDEMTQTLALPKDPPQVSAGDSRRLIFQVSPLSSKGLLSQQTRDALKILVRENGNAQAIHARAFVAGSGDIRRVPQIISDFFSEKKTALPAVSVVLTGALPMEGAQVVLELVSQGKKDTSPGGLEFVSAEPEYDTDAAASPQPLLQKGLDRLASKLGTAQPLRVSCFVSGLLGSTGMIADLNSRFPSVPVNLVQTQRLPYRAFAQCEAVAKAAGKGGGMIAFTGTRVAFGAQEKDATLAWQRLDRDLADSGSSPDNVIYSRIYQLQSPVAVAARKLRPAAQPISFVPVEGLAAIDAGFAVDAVAVLNK